MWWQIIAVCRFIIHYGNICVRWASSFYWIAAMLDQDVREHMPVIFAPTSKAGTVRFMWNVTQFLNLHTLSVFLEWLKLRTYNLIHNAWQRLQSDDIRPPKEMWSGSLDTITVMSILCYICYLCFNLLTKTYTYMLLSFLSHLFYNIC